MQTDEALPAGRSTGIKATDPEEALPECSEDGVDLTLIRWMLSLTPAERLQVLQDNIRSIQELRGEPADI